MNQTDYVRKSRAKPPAGRRWAADGRATTLMYVTDEWLTMVEAAVAMCASIHSMYYLSPIMKANGIGSRPRSMIAESARGCGLLWCARDIAVVALIQKKAQLRPLAAIRVFGAMRRNEFNPGDTP